ncbi:MAG: L-glutamate gamma-semialdehyde dehydrogenase [Pseudobdellovibrionaceae bacterium]|nr:L-glutamate gamma-semialdehyde dehydrogenase [Bdellovibrionales bacterium]USN48914.1 MAG: L-glutamate gamma-semialdehyde dehydrogenase [Pseudobdellovibrionaceae bacterium]
MSSPEHTHLFESKVLEKGQLIFSKMGEQSGPSIFNSDWWYGRIMDWSMKNVEFKTNMFRFVDVFPYLNSGAEVTRHLKEYFAENGGELPPVFNFGMGVSSLAPGLLSRAIKKNIVQMAKMFITGETPEEALPKLKKARKQNLCFTADLLGEATLSEKEALEYQTRYRELLVGLVKDAKSWSHHSLLDEDDRGPIPKVNVSVKLTSLYSQINAKAWDETVNTLADRLRPLLLLAKENFVFVNVDMEQYDHKDLTLAVFKKLLLEPELRDYPHFGIVIQAYLRDSLADLHELATFAKERGTAVTVRLVKGAYWDFETIHAEQQGWPIPVYTNKKESDKNFEDCAQFAINNIQHVRLAIGSHNVRSISAALIMAEEAGLSKNAIEVQMLYGMADSIKKTLANEGYRVREYATIGELIPGMAYLVRRLLENTSNESFLRSKFSENIPTEKLMQNPGLGLEPSSNQPKTLSRAFHNNPFTDFAIHSERQKMETALRDVQSTMGQTHPLVIDHKNINTERTIDRYNPSHPDQLVGRICLASNEHADLSVTSARTAFTAWKKASVNTRTQVLKNLADILERDRYTLAATQVIECGKPWSEADGDIAEAIDFCRYYAAEMLRIAKGDRTGSVPGESNWLHYQPIGVTLVIAPWNFPLAILTGMVTAAVVTGNTVIMKPAEQSSVTASLLMSALKEAGCPAGVVNYLPGIGEEVGEYLTGHKDVDLIAFTGSKAVGLHIVNKAGQIVLGQRHVKRCIIEMGGKNAIILDSDADLDEAIHGVVYSAFGFQGQKCSACSRVIVLESIYDRFVERLVEAVKSIRVLPADNPAAFMGPVIDEEAQRKILGIIEESKATATLAYQGDVPKEGFFVPPTVFTDVDPHSSLAQEEIFGPVLAVIKVKDLETALQVANDVEYGLTGGVYSRSPANIELVKEEFNVGNLYINRGITGALVQRHPFGGFKMSGLGSKTGSPDYLLHFMHPRNICENTMRRGFAPDA